jgi:hypothetical protein
MLGPFKETMKLLDDLDNIYDNAKNFVIGFLIGKVLGVVISIIILYFLLFTTWSPIPEKYRDTAQPTTIGIDPFYVKDGMLYPKP